jgi:protein gp37
MISKIQWTDYTFNPWIGCSKVSAGCAHCYAETQDNFRKWTTGGWGPGKPRTRTKYANWLSAKHFASKAFVDPETGEPRRPRIFCASLADVFDDEVPAAWFLDLMTHIRQTPGADYQLLTKRPENFRSRMEAAIAHARETRAGPVDTMKHPVMRDTMEWCRVWMAGDPPRNVWMGATGENHEMARERAASLAQIPAELRFLSCEPMLGPIDLDDIPAEHKAALSWIICGGESGGGARPFDLDWARDLRGDCAEAGIAFFMKQVGSNAVWGGNPYKTATPKGGEMSEWPEMIQGRAFPAGVRARNELVE